MPDPLSGRVRFLASAADAAPLGMTTGFRRLTFSRLPPPVSLLRRSARNGNLSIQTGARLL